MVEISPALRDFLKTPVFEDLEDEERQMQAIHRFYFLRALGPEIRKAKTKEKNGNVFAILVHSYLLILLHGSISILSILSRI